MKKFLGLAAIIAALGFLFAAAGCSNASDSNNAALLGLLNGTPAQPTTTAQPSTPAPAPTELEIPLTLEAIEDGEITLKNPWSALKYKMNDGEFQTLTVKIQTNVQAKQSYEPTYASIQVKAGDKVSFFADGSENDIDNGKLMMIQAQKDCYIYGNIMSLVDSSDYKSKTALNDRAAFAMLFRNNKHIKNHSEKKLVLPATTITYACYSRMFESCAALTSAPDLPATTLAESCYSGMFSSCEALTTVPALPATTLAQSCYSSMFSSCEALTTAPELPATTLAQSCYSSMFNTCSNLTTAPAALPATTLTANCYERMFIQCKKLEKAPDLPAKTLVKECYSEMFYECEKLNYIKCLAEDISASACTSSWLTRTASTGTFIKNNSAGISTDKHTTLEVITLLQATAFPLAGLCRPQCLNTTSPLQAEPPKTLPAMQSQRLWLELLSRLSQATLPQAKLSHIGLAQAKAFRLKATRLPTQHSQCPQTM